MKKLYIFIILSFLNLSAFAQVGSKHYLPHNGGNGGDDLELELRKISLQISSFLGRPQANQIFPMLNLEEVSYIGRKVNYSISTKKILDRYNTERTCVNEPAKEKITCNRERINDLIRRSRNETLVTLIFHEILGILEIELGHQDNVSMYPISSKILPYAQEISKIKLFEDDFIIPESFEKKEKTVSCMKAMKNIGANPQGDSRLWWVVSCQKAQRENFDTNMGSCIETLGRLGATGNHIYMTVWLDACLSVSPKKETLVKFQSCANDLIENPETLKSATWIDYCLRDSLQ